MKKRVLPTEVETLLDDLKSSTEADLLATVGILRDKLLDLFGKKPPFDPAFGAHRGCICSHPYVRHFDTYDDMSPAPCKDCGCDEYEEGKHEHACRMGQEYHDTKCVKAGHCWCNCGWIRLEDNGWVWQDPSKGVQANKVAKPVEPAADPDASVPTTPAPPALEDIFNNPTTSDVPDDPQALVDALVEHVNEDNFDAFGQYLDRVPPNIALPALEKAIKTQPQLYNHPGFVAWAMRNRDLFAM